MTSVITSIIINYENYLGSLASWSFYLKEKLKSCRENVIVNKSVLSNKSAEINYNSSSPCLNKA